MDIPSEVVKKLKKSKLKKKGKDIVFYHGTDADFKHFSNDFEGQNFSMGNFWKGMYFTKPLYAVGEKFKKLEQEWNKSDINKFEDYILSLGYDAIIHIDKKRSRMSEVILFGAKIIIDLEDIKKD